MENFSPRFWDQDGILLIFQRAKLWKRNITNFRLSNWMTFWRRHHPGISPKVTCSCMKMTRLTGHLNPRRYWPTWTSSTLIVSPILRISPRRTTTCSTDRKRNWKVATFLTKLVSLLPRGTGLTYKFLIFLMAFRIYSNRLRSVLKCVGSVFSKSLVWSL